MLSGVSLVPMTAAAQEADGSLQEGGPEREASLRDGREPLGPAAPQGAIISEAEFEEAVPALSDDLDAPLAPMKAFEAIPSETELEQDAGTSDGAEAIADAPTPADAELAQPLVPLENVALDPPAIEGVDERDEVELRYVVDVNGLGDVDLRDPFFSLSALEEGDGTAANAAMIRARAREDEELAIQLLQSEGYYDGTAAASIETPADGEPVRVVLDSSAGQRYRLGSVTIDAPPTEPPGLIDEALPLQVGEPIVAERIKAAEANVSLVLPQQGYPFAEVGERDILLDAATGTGAYTLPVAVGPRSSFCGYSTTGNLAFDADHVGTLARFDRGELYDNRLVDDLREALIATSLFSTVSVEPERTGETLADGTECVNLLVRQNAGPPRTLAGQAGYSTGEGFRIEGSWTHRNLFPPEGAVIVSGVAGTREQGLSGTFRRSNAGRRDRTFTAVAAARRGDFEAYEGYTGTLSVRWSYDSTPIWQKRFTYAYGAELVGTNEDRWDFAAGERVRDTYFIAALPLMAKFDTSDDLLNPTEGSRLTARVSPEGSVQGAARPYGRFELEGTAYYPVTDSIVIAGRAAAGSIQGIDRDDLAPSRRFYAGGGGSVRGFGYQEVGPEAPDDRPIGGRSVNEFSLEARYRFGNFGIVPFVDAGQVYESTLPELTDLRFGAGIGGRFYTNFGPLRVDVATPINKREDESWIALYISIGQAF